ncbi:MAG TPA: Crp/Fnr family transcriptional regulator [Streptosporangiaceae bacterium]|nr:Crp/Fnr family transcriptional regulator [Streptosporangiaceae bacterium]
MTGQQEAPGGRPPGTPRHAVPGGGPAGTPVLASALAGHRFLRGMPEAHLCQLAQAASLISVPAGHRFFTAGGVPHRFWLIRAGQVALDIDAPGQRRIILETLGRGEVIGLSWSLPPLTWQFGAVAIQPTEAFEFDAEAVRRLCDEDSALGFEFTRRLLAAVAQRLQATRLKVLDLSVQLAAQA